MLTDRECRQLEPKGDDYEVDVGGCEGLKLRVLKSGRRVFTLRYRTRAGQQRRHTLGPFPAVGLAKARADALKVLGDIKGDGADPSAERKRGRADGLAAKRMSDLFGRDDATKKEVAPGWFLGTYARNHAKRTKAQSGAKTAASIETDRGYIRKHLRGRRELMAKRLEDVTTEDLRKIKEAIAKDTPGSWRKLRAILRIGFRHAVDEGWITHRSPVEHDSLKASKDGERKRRLSAEERQALNAALAQAEAIGPHKEGGLSAPYVRLFRLLAATGMRRGEGLDARWEQLDLAAKQLRLPDSKTGEPRIVPLSDQAVAWLKAERGAVVGRVGRICGNPSGDRLDLRNLHRGWSIVLRRAEIQGATLHDLRRSWASDAVDDGVPLPWIAKALGHGAAYITERYARTDEESAKKAAKIAGDAIERRSKGQR